MRGYNREVLGVGDMGVIGRSGGWRYGGYNREVLGVGYLQRLFGPSSHSG